MFSSVPKKLVIAKTVHESFVDLLLFNFKWTLYQLLSRREQVLNTINHVIRLRIDGPADGDFDWHKWIGM